MKEPPEGLAELQRAWSVSRSDGIRNGARSRVDNALSLAAQHVGRMPESVLVVGPQHGFEPERYRERGVEVIHCVDVVPLFQEDCEKLGITCDLSAIETWTTPTTYEGVHASHVLEHCYDMEQAMRSITAACHGWLYVSLPIEPCGGKDLGHLSRLKDDNDLRRYVSDDEWTVAKWAVGHENRLKHSLDAFLVRKVRDEGTPPT